MSATRVHAARSPPVGDTAAAIRYLLDGRARGKVVVTVASP